METAEREPMKVSWPIAAGALALSAPAYAASDSETGATIVAFIFLGIALVIYFIPTIIAVGRNHQSRMAIMMTNILLGWTLLGWIVALIWSLTGVWKSPSGPGQTWPGPGQTWPAPGPTWPGPGPGPGAGPT